MPDLLNPYQYNALAVALAGFEQSLREAELTLRGEGAIQGSLHRAVLRLGDEQREAALQRIAEALEIIAQLAAQFALTPGDADLGRKIAAAMSVHWANLIDTQSNKLARYGAVDPALGAQLDPPIERLARLALDIASLVGAQNKQEVNDELAQSVNSLD